MENLYKHLLETNKNNVFTGDMSDDEWRELRRKSVGGSEAGAILRLSKYASPLTVYLDKKGLNNFRGNTATERGNFLEDPIRQRCKKELGILIEEVPYMFWHNEHSFMSANIDGLIYIQNKKEIAGIELSGFGGHEIKTSEMGVDFGDDEIPDTYYAQVQHYMAVLGLKWFIVSVYFINKNTLKHYVIKRDDEFISRLIAAEKEFWEDYVEKDIMPAPQGVDAEADLIIDMFEGSAATLILDDEAASLSAEYLLINEQLKELDIRKSQIALTIKLKIIAQQKGSDDNKVKAVAGKYNISFSKFLRKSVDTDRLKKDGLYDSYSKESESGMFRITEPKGA